MTNTPILQISGLAKSFGTVPSPGLTVNAGVTNGVLKSFFGNRSFDSITRQ